MVASLFRKTLLCPYCLRDFALRDAVYECEAGCLEEDLVYAKEWGSGIGRPKVVPATRGALGPNGAMCPGCNLTTHKRGCTHCHMPIPSQLWEGKTEFFALVGDTAVGKSHLLTAAICEMRDSLGSDLGFHLEMLGDRAMEIFEKEYYEPVYGNKTVLGGTRPRQSRAEVREPLAIRLAMKSHAAHLLVFDVAGLHYSNEKQIAMYSRHLLHATGLVFIINPLRIESVSQLLNLPRDTQSEMPDLTLSRLAQKLRAEKGLRMGQKIDVPIAMTISKADVLHHLLDKDSVLHSQPDHDGGANLRDLVAVDREVRRILRSWNQQNLVEMADQNFERCAFFATSALGSQAVNGRVAQLKPHRVSDPFVWLLHEREHIDGFRSPF